jgi:hypothetical protein
MTDDDGGRIVWNAVGDALQGGRAPVGDGSGGLAARRYPGGECLGILLPDLGVGLALPGPAVPLAQILVELDAQAGQPRQGGGGLGGPAEVGGEDRAGLEGGQVPRGASCLLAPGSVQGDVGLALEPLLGIECGLPVPPQDKRDFRNAAAA